MNSHMLTGVVAVLFAVALSTVYAEKTAHLDTGDDHATYTEEHGKTKEQAVAAGKQLFEELQTEGRAQTDAEVRDNEHVVGHVLLVIVEKAKEGDKITAESLKALQTKKAEILAEVSKKPGVKSDVATKFVDVMISEHYDELHELEAALQYATDCITRFEGEVGEPIKAQFNLVRTPDMAFREMSDGPQAAVNESLEKETKKNHEAIKNLFKVHSKHLHTVMNQEGEIHAYADIASWILRHEQPNKGQD